MPEMLSLIDLQAPFIAKSGQHVGYLALHKKVHFNNVFALLENSFLFLKVNGSNEVANPSKKSALSALEEFDVGVHCLVHACWQLNSKFDGQLIQKCSETFVLFIMIILNRLDKVAIEIIPYVVFFLDLLQYMHWLFELSLIRVFILNKWGEGASHEREANDTSDH